MKKSNFLITVLLILVHLSVFGQVPVKGTYIWTDPAGLASMSLKFDGTAFSQTSYSDTDSLKGAGNFLIEKKKLILLYANIKPAITSRFEVINQKPLKAKADAAYIELNVIDLENEAMPFNGAFIVLKKDSGDAAQIFTDRLGKANFIVWDTKLIQSIRVGFIGYDWVTVPLDRYARQQVEIKFALSIANIKYIEEGRTEFDIEEMSDNRLKISNKNYSYILEKENTGK